MNIKFKLFGVPEILIDEEKVLFPYSKINAFIYYILIEKTVSRSEMAGLLWPEEGEKTAKKNLRNVLYHAKKQLGKDFILSPNNTILQINEEYDYKVDVLEYLKDPKQNGNLYDGEFLKGFFLKESEEFENWLRDKRTSLFEIYYSTLQEKAEEEIFNTKNLDVESNIQRLISMDNLDEKNYRLLMSYYLNSGRISRVIETYGALTKLLKKELNVEPDVETKEIYNLSLDRYVLDDDEKEEFVYFGREFEIVKINKFINDYLENKRKNTIYIQGDTGLGKTTLTTRVMDDFRGDFKIYTVYSYQSDRNRILKPFEYLCGEIIKDFKLDKYKPVIDKIKAVQKLRYTEDYIGFEIERLEDLIMDLVSNIKGNVIINFEDIHFCDVHSISILTNLILKSNDILFFINGADYNNPNISDMILTLRRYDKIEKIKLEAFTKAESIKFLKNNNLRELEESIYEKIYSEAEGVPFFLWEFLKEYNLKKEIGKLNINLENSIRSRFIYLTDEERDILEILSFFKGGIPMSVISQVLEKDERVIVELLDKMEKGNVLEEYIEEEKIYFRFTHKKIREYLYSINSKTKRRYFHKIIGNILEKSRELYQNELKYFQELSYHFKESGEFTKELKFNIEILNHYLNFSHELFPVLDILDENLETTMYTSGEKIREMFLSLKEDLDNVEKLSDVENIEKLKLKFYHMKGRYLIREGRYEEGLEDIKYIIRRGKINNDEDYILNGYKQMIFYNIQRNNSQEMLEYIEEALKLAVRCNYHKEIGMLLRLKGLGYIMKGDYENGEKLLIESINTFNITDSIASEYAVNIAAAHNYIGEIRLANKEYEKAVEEFETAIELVKGKNVFSSLSVFYINMGKTYFALKNIKKAKEYFNLAQTQYEKFDSFWKMPVLNSYMSMIELMDENLESSKEFLELANKYSDKMGDPRSVGTVNFVKYFISKEVENNDIKTSYGSLLSEPKEFYKKEAIRNLDEFRDVFEMEKLLEN